jgi:hypothetical protein
MSTTAEAAAKVERVKRRYEQGEERPLGSFLVVMGGYGTLVAAATGILRAKGRRLPERIPFRDLALGAVATHKVSRLLAKDPVSSPFRAPFTEFEGQSGEAEISEEVVGSGLQHAVGELLTCPFCLDVWVATTFVLGFIAKPELARTVAGLFGIVATADVLQFGYDALQQSES